MSDASLTAIHVYPVKSCRAVALETVTVAPTGLEGDRLYQVVDEAGAPLTQRQHPRLATVQPTLLDGGMRLDVDGGRSLEVAHHTANTTEVSNLLGSSVGVADLGDDAARWFGELIGVGCRLVAMTDESDLFVPQLGVRTSFADAAPTLVANTASLDWLAERASEPFGMDRFRPNLTVTGADAWDEDTWRAFTIGAARLGIGLSWPRCAIPQIDQESAERHHEPARVLRAHRWCERGSLSGHELAPLLEGNAMFGIACSIEATGTVLNLGDPVAVVERGAPLVAPPA